MTTAASPKELLEAAIDASLASETGDIEIAEDLQQTSAWLVAIATALMYFSFDRLRSATSMEPMMISAKASYTTALVLLAISFASAYRVRSAYVVFRGYCRNLVVARKILLAQLLQNPEAITQIVRNAKQPLWVILHSNEISKLVPGLLTGDVTDVVKKQVSSRERVDVFYRFQRRTVVLGTIAAAVGAGINIAAVWTA